MERRFGHDFGRVRVHDGREAARSAGLRKARAYTLGENIVFGAGEYRPESSRGRKLIAHELTHVVQQSPGEPDRPATSAPDTESEAAEASSRIDSGLPLGRSITRGAPMQPACAPTDAPPAIDDDHLSDTLAELFSKLPPKVRDRILKYDTVALGLVQDDEGDHYLVYTVAGDRTSPSLRAAARDLGITEWKATPRAEGRGAVGAPGDAEQRMIESAETNSFKVLAIVPSRAACRDCGPAMADESVHNVGHELFRAHLEARLTKLGQAAPDVEEHEHVHADPTRVRIAAPPTEEEEDKSPAAPRTNLRIAPPKVPDEEPGAPGGPGGSKVRIAVPSEEADALAGHAVGQGIVDLLGHVTVMILQPYYDKLTDPENKKKMEADLKAAQPLIEQRIQGHQSEIDRLTNRGAGAYAYVTLDLTTRSTPDPNSGLTITWFAGVTIIDVVIQSGEGKTQDNPYQAPFSLRDVAMSMMHQGESIRRISYPVKIVAPLADQIKDADTDVKNLSDSIGQLDEQEGDDPSEMDDLLSQQKSAVARQKALKGKASAIWEREEAARKKAREEDRKKDQDALKEYDAARKSPPKTSSETPANPAAFLDPASPAPSSMDLPLPFSKGTTDEMGQKMLQVARVFAAQKEDFAQRAEALRTASSNGQGRTEEYARQYSAYWRDFKPWPKQFSVTLAWAHENAPGAHDALEKLEGISSWWKSGGRDSLIQIPKPE